MLRDNPKLMAAGAFLAGGILVGGVTLGTAVAHGAGTGIPGKGLSAPQYEATNAWSQQATSGVQTTFSIPTGDRLTITNAIAFGAGGECDGTAALNGVKLSYLVNFAVDGNGQSAFSPIYADAGEISCSGGIGGTLIGYLTPITTTG